MLRSMIIIALSAGESGPLLLLALLALFGLI